MPEPVDRIGSLIDGRYKITEVMASGAMGAVFKAERVPIGKLVAVKVLHASVANDSEFQARFERETRVMSKLNHPNCVSVLDFGAWEGSPYLVMDYVDGTTLRARLDKGPIPALQALGMARQVLAGLAHAHQQEVFHRDVKPANIMISEEIGHGERVRILDFGLARLQGNVGRDATQTNMVVGTPNYMAPEQTVPGSMIDARTDLYAVGVVLFEMVVGERPFHSEDTLQLLGMHRAAPIPRLADRVKPGTDIPIGLQEIIDKAMAKSAKARYQSAIEFADAIDEVTTGKLDPMEIDATLPKMKSGPVVSPASSMALGDTAVQLETTDVVRAMPRKKGGGGWFFLLLLVAGASAAGVYFFKNGGKPAATESKAVALQRDAGPLVAVVPDAQALGEVTPPPIDAGVESDAAIDAAIDAAGELAGVENDAGIIEEEIQIDPTVAADPDEANKGSAAPPEDEAPDAPKTEEEVEKKETPPPAPQLARTVHDAVVLIQKGEKPLALASLRELWKKQQNSAYIPFLMGNLYFDKQWWGVSLDHYRAAIKKNAGYRRNPVLNKNVIRMLASAKTRQTATNFLRGVIGSYAKPYLKAAATSEKNAVVRKQAASLARVIR
jgi:tRNA A-37 threonylcarbamoyl transferase component Bud32